MVGPRLAAIRPWKTQERSDRRLPTLSIVPSRLLSPSIVPSRVESDTPLRWLTGGAALGSLRTNIGKPLIRLTLLPLIGPNPLLCSARMKPSARSTGSSEAVSMSTSHVKMGVPPGLNGA